MKPSTILALAASVIPALAAPKYEVLQVESKVERQVSIGWTLWIGVRSGLAVCAGIPPPCQLETTWIVPNNLDNICDRFGTGSPFPQPSSDVQYCGIEFGDPDFCNAAIFHMDVAQDGDCPLNGGEGNIRFAGLYDADNVLVGSCEKTQDVDGQECGQASGSSVLTSLLKCTVDYAEGRCNAI